MNKQTFSRVKMDCNWMVKDASKMREQIKAIKLAGVTDTEQRLLIKIEIRAMNWNEMCDFLKTN